MVTDSMIDNATRFVIANGRLVERRLLELVRGPAQPTIGHAMLAALDGYRNADGGLEHGLEADAQMRILAGRLESLTHFHLYPSPVTASLRCSLRRARTRRPGACSRRTR